jgi:hypothetical protein
MNLEALHNRELYGETTALEIEVMGSMTVSIANRWALGWPERVRSLLLSGSYLQKLCEQGELEKDVLAEAYMPHLATFEVLRLHGIQAAPGQ